MLTKDSTLLMVVDVQGKLAQLMHERESLFRNLEILVQGAQVLGIPIIWVEQNPKGLGPTVPELARWLVNFKPVAKTSFSACGAPEVVEALRASPRKQVLLAGIEAHVCIYLTAVDLLAAGYSVEVVADAVSSRTAARRQVGLNKAAALGASITCTETALFELLRRAEGQEFKAVLRLLK